MRLHRALALGASMLALVSACTTGGGSTPAASSAAPPSAASQAPASSAPQSQAAKPTIKIGSDGFYEAKLVAEMYGQALEYAGYTVDRTGIGIGARKVSAPALESGQFDIKPEYIGSGLAYYSPGTQTG
ncbi:MAG TPA: glycine betaine ABC transporter substrate-binding protein, partial [Candidatus Acidoferrum sp.]|nr:glycine betaine ABC transporter substrate-binding protein [Candidatus Acidoferrum sp.]